MTSLEEFLGDAYPEPESDGYGGYHIGKYGDALSEANWAMRKLAGLRAKQLEIALAGNAELSRIGEWIKVESKRHDVRIGLFEGMLKEWHHAEMAKALAEAGGDWGKVKGKSQRLTHGVVGARKQSDEWVYDEPAFIAWAEAEWPALVRTTVTVAPDKVAARKTFAAADGVAVDTATGQPVPGITIEPGDIAYTVNVSAPSKEDEEDD